MRKEMYLDVVSYHKLTTPDFEGFVTLRSWH